MLTEFLANALQQIAARQALRLEAKLPLLSSVAAEIRKLKLAKDERALDALQSSPHGAEVKAQVLKEWQDAVGDPNWRPSWMIGMSISNEVRRRLRQQLRKAR